MAWSVVIPSARSNNLIHCVESILGTHSGMSPRQIVIVDDGARDRAEHRLPSGITWIEGIRPFVFARNVNLGVSSCAPDDVVILGDDSQIVTRDCFNKLARVLTEHPTVAVLSPELTGRYGTSRHSGCRPMSTHADENSPYDEMFALEEQPQEGGKSSSPPATPAVTLEREALPFVCVMIPRLHWQTLGPLDERFTGYGCEDVDYCWRAREAGLDLAIYHPCKVFHGAMRSTFRTRGDFEELHRENTVKLRSKWKGRTQ
jgi:GT2 family glycosyltransferase